MKLRLKDQFIQKWHESISQGGKTFGFENYLDTLPQLLRKYLKKFRCRNHRLPIEAGVRSQVLRDMRLCHLCQKDIGVEYHYKSIQIYTVKKNVNLSNISHIC